VTIPKSLRTRYGVRPGQEVVFETREDGVLIKRPQFTIHYASSLVV